MNILVFNAGSSSLKFGLFDLQREDHRILKGEFERFQNGQCQLHYRVGGEQGQTSSRTLALASLEEAIGAVPALLQELGFNQFDAVGHRVAHGADRFHDATLIDDDVLRFIEACTPLAPLHNPANLLAIQLARRIWPDLPQVAVFDTAFHHSIPERAYTYAVPKAWRDKGLRRYGFHGTSHKYVGLRVAKALQRPVTELQIISCHLGNGASCCAINRGFSIDTSMGMTPLEGLVMGTRSGDLDPGAFDYLSRELGLNTAQIEKALYSQSGLLALAGVSDMRDVEDRAASGDAEAQLALEVYAYRVRKYIGAYAAAMGGLDAIAFTGGIGENSASMRRRICDRLQFLGLFLEDSANQSVRLQAYEAPQIQAFDSRVKVLVTQTCEQYMIAQEAAHLLKKHTRNKSIQRATVPVAISARHVHLSQTAVDQLFGEGYQLNRMRSLSQPEGWAASETLDIVGPKGCIAKVRILGPTRDQTQIEVSKTDTFTLGIDAPVRPSGKLENTPVVRLHGPAGNIETDGLIIAARHIHMSPEDANQMGFKDGDYVDVQLGNQERHTTFANTLIRVKAGYVTEMHIDTDEANAANLDFQTEGALVVNAEKQPAEIISVRNMSLNGNGKTPPESNANK